MKNILFAIVLLIGLCIMPLKPTAMTEATTQTESLIVESLSDDTMLNITFINNEKDIVLIKMIFTLGIAILLVIFCKGLLFLDKKEKN